MRLIWKIVLSVLACLVLVFAGFYVYFFELGGLEKLVNSQIASLLSDRYNLDVMIGKITGNLFSGLTLEDVSIFYVDSSRSYLLVDCPSISTRYALSNLWNKNYRLEYLYLDSSQITIIRDTVGHWLLPAREPTTGESNQVSNPQFSVDALNLNNVSLTILDGHDTLALENIELSLALQGIENTYAIDVDRLEFTSSDDRFKLDAAGGKLTYSDSKLLFRDLSLLSGDTRVKLNGHTELGKTPRGQVDFAIDNINLREVSKFIKPRLKGVIDLNGSLTFEGNRLAGTVDMGGDFMFTSFENIFVGFRFADKHLLIDTLYGMVFDGCAIDGTGNIDFSTKPRTYRLKADISNFNLKSLVKNSYSTNLNGHIDLNGESFHKETLMLGINTELFESVFDEYHFHEALGDLIITTDSLVFVDSFSIKYYENTFHVAGRINYKEQTDLHITADLANLDRYRGK
ncbi:MAG: hypothetical protein U9R56_02150, partial [candidate division Zixibacteria bacterium]|nr:hypothetical protein [candidate division Zixibacteria bacterium]